MESHVRHEWPGSSPSAGLRTLWEAWGECGLNSGMVAGVLRGCRLTVLSRPSSKIFLKRTKQPISMATGDGKLLFHVFLTIPVSLKLNISEGIWVPIRVIKGLDWSMEALRIWRLGKDILQQLATLINNESKDCRYLGVLILLSLITIISIAVNGKV